MPHSLSVFMLLLVGGLAHAEEGPVLRLQTRPSDTHLLLGPSVSLVYRDEAFDSEVGGQILLHKRRDSRALSDLGLTLSAATFARYDAIRVELDLYAGTRLIEALPFGLALGPVVDLYRSHRPRGGAKATFWLYTGVAPYVSVATMYGLGVPPGAEFEIGIKVPLSAFSW